MSRHPHFRALAACAASALITIPSLTACSGSSNEEAGGAECLAKARAQLADKDFAGARASIDTLRTKFAMAFNAREEGILLLDSIEIAAAGHDLQVASDAITASQKFPSDSLQFMKEEAEQKIKFYTKKLAHDKANFKKH